MGDWNPPDDDDDDVDAPGEKPDSKNFADLRKHARSVEKQLRTVSTEVEELRAYKSERDARERSDALTNVFKAIGLKETQIGLFPSDAEPTEVSIKEWATKHDLVTSAEVEVPGNTPASSSSEGFKPPGGTDGGTAPGGKMSHAAWVMELRSNPARARYLLESGQVDTSEIDKLAYDA